jgi:N-methylhydantoinase B
MGSVRVLELLAPMTISCYHSSERLYPWGLFGGGEGSLSSFEVKTPGDAEFKNFKERFGVRCAGKFTNVRLPAGSMLALTVGGGGGYGDPGEREPDRIAVDLLEQFEDERSARVRYPAQFDEAIERRDALLDELRAR